jgi:ribonuclease-3
MTGGRPSYHLLDATGPDHEKQFQIEVSVDGVVLGRGLGSSRRIAETEAAAQALESLRSNRSSDRAAGDPKGRPA